MRLRNFISSLLAGFGATTVHFALMAIKHRAGILPEFEPYEDLQRLLSSVTARSLESPFSWLLPYINGALIIGFVFGRLFTHLPGSTPIVKGGAFGFAVRFRRRVLRNPGLFYLARASCPWPLFMQ
jgi:hypothetical protein